MLKLLKILIFIDYQSDHWCNLPFHPSPPKKTAHADTLILGRKKTMLKTIFTHGGIYTFLSVASRAIPFLLLPIMTAYISPDGYGMISIFMIITSLLTPVIGFCSNSVLQQKFFKLNEEEKVYFMADAFKLMILSFIFYVFLCLVVYKLIYQWIKIPLLWFELAILVGLFNMIISLTTTLFRLKKQPLMYGLLQGAMVLTNVALSIFFVVCLELSWQGRLCGILISSFLVSSLSIYCNFIYKNINFKNIKKTHHIGNVFRLGVALIPATITGWILLMSDRFFLTRLTSIELVGIYSVGIMIAQITDVLLNPIHLAYSPFFFEKICKNDLQTKLQIVRSTYLIIITSLMVALLIYLIAPIIFKLMINVRYHKALDVVAWISFSYAFWSIGGLFYNFVLSAEKNIIIQYFSYILLIISLFAGYNLIKYYGMIGAAIANLISSASFAMCYLIVTLRYFRMPWFDKRVFAWN
jgi:O-antigen/teichoic acid export membrane protein